MTELENIYKLIVQCKECSLNSAVERLQGKLEKLIQKGSYEKQNKVLRSVEL